MRKGMLCSCSATSETKADRRAAPVFGFKVLLRRSNLCLRLRRDAGRRQGELRYLDAQRQAPQLLGDMRNEDRLASTACFWVGGASGCSFDGAFFSQTIRQSSYLTLHFSVKR